MSIHAPANASQPQPWLHQRQIGRAQVFSLSDGVLHLDGGAMFGTVPRLLWQKLLPPDEQNRIRLRINPLLIQLNGKNILVETGMDDKSGAKFEAIFGIERDTTVFAGLAALGLGPNDIDLVINTHLHFDHAGRNTTSDLLPSFPRARYLVQRQEFADAMAPHERNRASYLAHNIEPIFERGLFDFLDGPSEIMPGLSVLPVPGHNLGQQAVVLISEGQQLVYTADLLPTFSHVPYPYIMGYDLYPVTTLATRKRLFPQWFDEKTLIVPPHDPLHPWGYLQENPKGGYQAHFDD
jgi:glyoxylase-like metal-dependent hydrolase (beta-lactamase superfamily II)